MVNKQKAQLLLEKADHTTYVWSPVSDFQSWRQSNFTEVTQFHACYVNGMLLSKATINAGITNVTCDDTLSSRQVI